MINEPNIKLSFSDGSPSSYINLCALLLTIVGALNWGLVGIAGCNLVESLFGSLPYVPRIIYTLVGISGVYLSLNFSRFLK